MASGLRKRGVNLSTGEEKPKEECVVKRRKKLETKTVESPKKKSRTNSSTGENIKNKKSRNSSDSTVVVSKKNEKSRKNPESSKEENKTISVEEIENLNVAQLLALGEKTPNVNVNQNCEVSTDSEGSLESDSDFEEVKNIELTEPVIPKEGVNVTLEVPSSFNKRKKKGIDLESILKRQLNKVRKDLQQLMHKVHFLCWIAHLRFVNSTLIDPVPMQICLSLVKSKNLYPSKYSDLTYLEGILKWFHKNFELKKNIEDPECSGGLSKELCYQLEKKVAFTSRAFTFMFIILLRALGLKARVVMSFQVLPIKPSTDELQDVKTKPLAKTENKQTPSCSKVKEEESNSVDTNDCTEKDAEILKKNKSGKRKSGNNKDLNKSESVKKSKAKCKDSDGNESDEFESIHFTKKSVLKGKTKRNSSVKGNTSKNESHNKNSVKEGKSSGKKTQSINSISSGDEDCDFTPSSIKKKVPKKGEVKSEEGKDAMQNVKKKEGQDVWTEVYLEAEEKWISVDVSREKVHCISELHSRATHPVVYVIACNNNMTMKDVTKRYVPNWHSDTRKRRVDDVWLDETMKPYLPPKTALDREEDEDINRQIMDKPLPASISEFKDHPLYALKRHLLKFEGIYPPDAPTLGFVRGEPVYARECVVTLRSREVWYKEARVVRLKEEPYKIVKARPKYDKMTGEIRKDLPLELFGIWQTEPFIPPKATDGKVPRNEYGNVDLFKPCMLPIGTVHLQIPALNRIARKLGVDCAPATVGFDYHSGGSHPVFDGFVVCEEFKDILLDTWEKEIEETTRKNEEKREKKIYGNWKRLIRGLLIREKLKIKYAFGENSDEEPSTSKN